MSIDEKLVRALAESFLDRRNFDDALLEETAARLDGLLSRIRNFDETVLGDALPAFAFSPDHPSYLRDSTVSREELDDLSPAGLTGTGYGGTQGMTGTSHVEGWRSKDPDDGSHVTEDVGELAWMSATELAEHVRNRELSPVEVTRDALERIDALDGDLRSFVTVLADRALAEARRVEQALAAGDTPGPLAGVPVAVKDLYETAGIRTTAGSRLFANNVPSRDATTVRLLKQAGATIVGKTATHEFAFGTTTDSPFHGPVHNPWKRGHVPGGSSGGSGVAVAAGFVPCALGTDTGGSIRIPAAACGTVGLKPTYGRISKTGIVPLSWSLDHPGPLTRTVADAALFLQVLAGPDPLDPTTVPIPLDDYVEASQEISGLRGLRIGVPGEWLTDRIEPEIRSAVLRVLDALRQFGVEVSFDVPMPSASVMTLVNRLIALGEAAAYHAQFLTNRAGEYGPDVRARLELGQFMLARDYLLGQRLRGELVRHVNTLMMEYDVLALPSLPFPAPAIGQQTWDWGAERETVPEGMIRLTAPFNVTGQPALALPCGYTTSGLPISIQFVGRPFEETTLLSVSGAAERVLTGQQRRPPL